MGEQIKTKAIVLHEMPIGDYDKRLLLLTKECGKVTVFVKGARRPKNKLLAASQIFAYGDYMLTKGKNNYYINQADIIESFQYLQQDMEDLTYGMFFLEFASYVSQEEMSNPSFMYLVLLALKAVGKKEGKNRLIAQIFKLRSMVYLGLTPWVADCVICHKTEGLHYFSSMAGGLICKEERTTKDSLFLYKLVKEALIHILTQPVKEVFSLDLIEQDLRILEKVVTQFMDLNLNHRFKTLEFLKLL